MLTILADAAKYDVSCNSGGSKRKNTVRIGDAWASGMCHTYTEDGRCVSLPKILLTNHCNCDCAFCVSLKSNDVKRVEFTVEEVVELSISYVEVGQSRIPSHECLHSFYKSSDGLFYAIVEPDLNVLPLISSFFRKRYTDQPWLIYHAKRSYGLHYDMHHVQEVKMNPADEVEDIQLPSAIALDEKDELYQHLWKQYFKGTNIDARKNMKLHLRHVPRRYWKYLAEKQP
jgi:hypothetical protein